MRDCTGESEPKMPENTKKITDAELKQLGIKRVPTDTYHVGPYKYSNLNDALAEAERSSARHNFISKGNQKL